MIGKTTSFMGIGNWGLRIVLNFIDAAIKTFIFDAEDTKKGSIVLRHQYLKDCNRVLTSNISFKLAEREPHFEEAFTILKVIGFETVHLVSGVKHLFLTSFLIF